MFERLARGIVITLFAGAGLPWVVIDASAADAARGRQLAQQVCTGCHQIDPGSARAADTAPAITTIAASPDRDRAYLRAWLSTPHRTMPALDLTRDQIDYLAAYIGSLGTPANGPAL
ncbi:MAG: cytochrome c [Alphaproteobacteria bacterium]|nr:cytochrome c [Alphaproteobacteria bacterium]